MAEQPDAVVWANTKMQGDWSAPAVANQLSKERLAALLTVFPKGKLDNMVKVRLLLACLFLSKHDRQDMDLEQQQLATLGRSDDDEWVRTMALAVGDFQGPLNLDAVIAGNPTVRETMSSLQPLLERMHAPPNFLPLQEIYMHGDLKTYHFPPRKADHGHFKVREGPEARSLLPGFDLDSLLGPAGAAGLQLPGASLTRAMSAGAPSVHARRGMGLSGESGMFRSSRPDLPSKQEKTLTSPPPSKQPSLTTPGSRVSKMKALDVSEAIGLQHKLSLPTPDKRDAAHGVASAFELAIAQAGAGPSAAKEVPAGSDSIADATAKAPSTAADLEETQAPPGPAMPENCEGAGNVAVPSAMEVEHEDEEEGEGEHRDKRQALEHHVQQTHADADAGMQSNDGDMDTGT